MAGDAHPKTLFHLVPTNQFTNDTLLHPDNKDRVSSSERGLGLEVGYHVPSTPQGHVITRLGRNADLIVCRSTHEHPMSAVHVAFEIHPATHLVFLSVRSKRISSVTFAVIERLNNNKSSGEKIARDNNTGQKTTGNGVLLYGQSYQIFIASYSFKLIWQTISKTNNAESLEALAVQGYGISL